jgi:hypothetical protein
MEEEKVQTTAKTARTPITWDAHEYVHVEKNPDWYWALFLVAIAGTVGALLMNNILFAVFIIIASFVLALLASRHPEVRKFSITQRGVYIDGKLYAYNTLDSFSIDHPHHHRTPKLILKQKSNFAPIIIIPILDVDPDDIHDFLANLLTEDEHNEPLVHHVMEWLGF